MNPLWRQQAHVAVLVLCWSLGSSGCAKHQKASGAASQATHHAAATDASTASDAGVAAPPCVEPDSGLPTDIFCTGLYAGRDPKNYSDTAKPYTPGVVLWSDGAEKHRYLYLPPGSQIDTSDMDVWKFPVGTKAWKEFAFNGKMVETRLFWKRDETTWAYGTYIWDESGKNATLNTSRTPTVLDTGYEIPNNKDCGRCHHGGADYLLGVEAVALALPTAQGVTLSGLAAAGSLSRPPSTTSIQLPEDSTGKAAAALGYLHANCGMPCHSTRGLGEETKLVLRLRAGEFWHAADAGGDGTPAVTATDIYQATVNKDATTASVVQMFPDAHRITPGAHDKSLVYLLSNRRGMYQMPPIVSHKVDDLSMQKLADWIDALPP